MVFYLEGGFACFLIIDTSVVLLNFGTPRQAPIAPGGARRFLGDYRWGSHPEAPGGARKFSAPTCPSQIGAARIDAGMLDASIELLHSSVLAAIADYNLGRCFTKMLISTPLTIVD